MILLCLYTVQGYSVKEKKSHNIANFAFYELRDSIIIRDFVKMNLLEIISANRVRISINCPIHTTPLFMVLCIRSCPVLNKNILL